MTAIKDEPFGPYELLARLGDGPRGPVAIARTRDGEDALYVIEISAFASEDDAALRSYLHDVERAARIKHRNVLGIVDVGATTAGRYVALPYVEGCTLADLEDRHRAIRPPRLVLAAVIDALHGLHAAHAFRSGSAAQPLLHGSLTPGDLWIGLDGACRVGGFGHARRVVQSNPQLRSIAAGHLGYLAPEQLDGAPADHRTDLFALGTVLWNALTGKRLFHDRIDEITRSNVLERKIPRPSSIGLSPPPALDAIVMKSLERDPERRFQGAAEMAGALRDAARGASCLAPATELAEWVAATFGNDLAARRRAIRELCARPHPRGHDTVVLPRLVSQGGDAGGRDQLSLEELARATDASLRLPPDHAPGPPLTPELAPPARPRARLTLVAGAAFAAVAAVLGWRWSVTADEAPQPGGLEVTVLAVRNVGRPALATPSDPPEIKPATPSDPPEIKPATTSTPAPRATAPSRTTPRAKRRPAPAPARPVSQPPEVKPAEPAELPKPESPPRPTLESNPYIYNK